MIMVYVSDKVSAATASSIAKYMHQDPNGDWYIKCEAVIPKPRSLDLAVINRNNHVIKINLPNVDVISIMAY